MNVLAQSTSGMTTYVRAADVEAEKEVIADFLTLYLSSDANATNTIIGVSAAFPRNMHCDGKIVRGYVLGDFCIHPEHRSLGPAMALQRATLEALSKESAGFVLDFPSTSMLAIYKRLGIGVSETMPRYAKPLRANRQLETRIPNKAAANSLATVANLALRARDVQWKNEYRWTIAEETGSCGQEFTIADQNWNSRLGNRGARTAEYLNWRFLQHPHQRYRLLSARKDGKLSGFLIYQTTQDDARVVDLFAEEEAVCRSLLQKLIPLMRQVRINTISAPFLSSHPHREVFEDCGFQPREATPVVLLSLPWPSNRQAGQIEGSWYLTHGDRES